MVIGVMELQLALYDNESLKVKRSAVKRIIHRTQNKFNVAVAEVDEQDALDRAILGCVVVGNDPRFLRSSLDKMENFVVSLGLADVLDASKTIEHY